ncbi:hypothetical protein BRARA_C03467 [Brassica rapa]|uniref:Uncharacterized protein n=1 Tax=Brassica campestris TaxID=3711 RepID=A0A398A4E5_BRACM|nr:hypothetical protein BRARA_C03467 [Brassica rapa]
MKGKLWFIASLLVLSLLFSLETISAQPYKFRKMNEIRDMIHIHKTRKIQTPGSVTKRAGQGSDSNKGGSPNAG